MARQYTGSADKITNCQIGVFAALGLAPWARLHRPGALSAEGLSGRSRTARAKAHVPQEIGLATKPAITRNMLERALAAGGPFSWVSGTASMASAISRWRCGVPARDMCLGVSAKHAFNSWGKPDAVAGTAKDIAADRPPETWRRLSAGTGTKGERLHDWACIELADLDTADVDADFGGL